MAYDSANAPPEVAALKTMLEASATYATLTGATIHYPAVSIGDSASDVDPPHFLIEPVEDAPSTLAPGVVLTGGTIQVVLTMSDANGASIEKTARAIAGEVHAQVVGLPILTAKVGMASEPRPSERAAQAFEDENATGHVASIRTIALIFTYGLT